MDREFTPGKTVVSMKVSIKMTKSMGLEFIRGLMAVGIVASGVEANSTALEHT